jgi:hypothetical protein
MHKKLPKLEGIEVWLRLRTASKKLRALAHLIEHEVTDGEYPEEDEIYEGKGFLLHELANEIRSAAQFIEECELENSPHRSRRPKEDDDEDESA